VVTQCSHHISFLCIASARSFVTDSYLRCRPTLGDKLKEIVVAFHLEPFESDIFTHHASWGTICAPAGPPPHHPPISTLCRAGRQGQICVRHRTQTERFHWQGWPRPEGCGFLHQLCDIRDTSEKMYGKNVEQLLMIPSMLWISLETVIPEREARLSLPSVSSLYILFM
jgi:hypothetical protein